MATIDEMQEILHKINTGIELRIIETMEDHTDVIVNSICEQLYSGLDGKGQYLNPTYADDPYFDEPGVWQGRRKQYELWKAEITPPVAGNMLGLPARPLEVPNLFINGKFYSEIFAYRDNLQINVEPEGSGDGPGIVEKWGDDIMRMGAEAVGHFNDSFTSPAIEDFYEECGL